MCLSLLIVLDLSGIFRITFLFKGWWALFIIIPGIIGMINESNKVGPLFIVDLGVILLLCARGNIEWAQMWKYLLAMFVIIWGLEMMFGKNLKDRSVVKTYGELADFEQDGRKVKHLDFSFGNQDLRLTGEYVEGLRVDVSFGAATIDLRGAEIMDGAILDIYCSFTGVEVK